MKNLINKITRKWDWWIYCRSFHSIRRMVIDRPGFAYLMELNIRQWNKDHPLPESLKSATEHFHAAMTKTPANPPS